MTESTNPKIPIPPRYTRGSGPPPKKPSLLPAHDKKGVILGEIPHRNGSLSYIVGHEDHPAMRREVPVLNISDYVSNYELEQYTRRQDRIHEEERKARKKIEKASRQAAREAEKVAKQAAKLQKQESREGPRRSKRKSTEEIDAGTQPPKKKKRATAKSRSASASVSVKSTNQRGLSEVESESEFDDVSTAILLAQQLRGYPQVDLSSTSNKTRSSSRQYSSRPSSSRKSKAVAGAEGARSSVETSASSSGNSISLIGDARRRSARISPLAMAAISSMDAAAVWEDLERKKKEKSKEVL